MRFVSIYLQDNFYANNKTVKERISRNRRQTPSWAELCLCEICKNLIWNVFEYR